MNFVTNKGESLDELGSKRKVLLVFLRHFGCTFCRETMADLAAVRNDIESTGVKIVIVHMVSSEMAEHMLKIYDLEDVSHISDMNQKLYNRFGLYKVGFRALFGLKNWWRALVAGVVKGHLIGKPAGDPFQMPGVILLHKKKVLNNFAYKYVSDRPDFVKVAKIA
ncbi:MAG: SelL-related redox protein [Cryomorphaceae bacterium]